MNNEKVLYLITLPHEKGFVKVGSTRKNKLNRKLDKVLKGEYTLLSTIESNKRAGDFLDFLNKKGYDTEENWISINERKAVKMLKNFVRKEL